VAGVPGRAGCVDDEAWDELATHQVRLARAVGALNILPIALTSRAGVKVPCGRFAAAAALVDEADVITQATGTAQLGYTSLVLAAWRGRQADALRLIDASIRDAATRGEGRAITLAEYTAAVLHNGLGDYRRAFAAAERACEHDDLGLFGWALIELVEAAGRSGQPEALEALAERTRPVGTEWALGIEARSRALQNEGEAAERLYREAISRLSRTRIAVHLARAHLVYGEWLRRERRHGDAREQLRTAYSMMEAMGAEAFAERARRELQPTARPSQADRRSHGRGADRAGGPDRAAGPRRAVEPGDRRPAVHQRAHGPVPPGQGLHQARHQLAQPAGPGLPADSVSRPR
jgi:tetratricopeptide (TPR) repeat protein